MRALSWSQGFLILAAWHSIAVNVAHAVPAAWWAWLISWSLLGLASAGVSLARWAIGKAKAGALGGLSTARNSAPAGNQGE